MPSDLIGLRYGREEPADYQGDVERIVSIAAARGYRLSAEDARLAWQNYSDMMAAGWMGLPDNDDDVWLTVFYRLEADDATEAEAQ